jgi:glutamate-1-semialdehyde 2,1-aminomutase
MDSRTTTFALYALGAGALTMSFAKLQGRLALSKAKHRSLTGHSRIARRVAAPGHAKLRGERAARRALAAPG